MQLFQATGNKVLAWAVLVGVVVATLGIAATPAQTLENTCRVRDVTSDSGPFRRLQAVINQAQAGDQLTVKGRCIGNFFIDKDLTVVGLTSAARPVAVLNGGDASTVLRVRGGASTHLELVDLKITGGRGRGEAGGGLNVKGSVTLSGSTQVTGNRAAVGGGVFIVGGTSTLQLTDQAAISGNGAPVGCAGIYNARSSITMTDTSTVAENHGSNGPGGICSEGGTIALTDSSSISSNTGQYAGGLQLRQGAHVTMSGLSSISGNRADTGGGVYILGEISRNDSSSRLELTESASISGNDARNSGGGVVKHRGVVTLTDDASITGNSAGKQGGGIYQRKGRITLDGASTVTDNSAGDSGGGVFNNPDHPGIVAITGGATVADNRPDDCVGC